MTIACISDTHEYHTELEIPVTDCIVHTGDFTNGGHEVHTDDFLIWYSELPQKYKILIAGNHDFFPYLNNHEFKVKCHLLGIIYLQDSSVVINNIKFYGTPWVPKFFNWAFMEEDFDLSEIYDKIPTNTDILLTHGPAYKTLDYVKRTGNVGSISLKNRLAQLPNLKFHIFGHIHETSGVNTENLYTSINAASLGKFNIPNKVQTFTIKEK